MNAIVERALETLPLPDPALLDSAREDAATKARHDALAAEILALNAVEYRPPQADHLLGENLRLAAWNAERLKFGPASAALFTAHYLATRDAAEALARTTSSVWDLLRVTHEAQSRELQLVESQEYYAHPRMQFAVRQLR